MNRLNITKPIDEMIKAKNKNWINKLFKIKLPLLCGYIYSHECFECFTLSFLRFSCFMFFSSDFLLSCVLSWDFLIFCFDLFCWQANARLRKEEFAKLLEEHAQIVSEINRAETKLLWCEFQFQQFHHQFQFEYLKILK